MISAPLTPYEDSADNVENDSSNGRTSTGQSNTSYTTQPFALATPTTPSMILNNPNEAYTSGSRSISEDLMEESDQDMSDGGVPLAPGIEESNSEMDSVDDEIMGPDSMVGLHHDSHLQAVVNTFDTYGFSDGPNAPSEPGGNSYMSESHTPILEAINTADLPAVMSEVSQQLQHIQDGQEHGNFESASDEHHDLFINHNQSTPPLDSLMSFDNFLYQPSNFFEVVAQYFPSLEVDSEGDQESEADQSGVDFQFNMNFADFLGDWVASLARRSPNQPRMRGPSQPAVTSHCLAHNLKPLLRCELQGEECDIQRINWKDLGVTRLQARQRRQVIYKNYTNLIYPNRPRLHPRLLHGTRLRNEDNYFKFRQMDFQHEVYIRHFQLRNLIACHSQDCVIYAAKTQVMHYNPTIASTPSVLMDLGNSRLQSFHSSLNGYQISTLASGHDIVVAGGFEGEYALINTRAPKGTKHIEGTITEHPNDITNHAQVHLSRSSSPLVTFASNDSGIRTLDVTTNKFISEHMYDHAMNCTAVSPDRRLRVLVGDTRKVMICNTDTGELLQELDGHLDYGFACDWSEDGWTVATGNQDMQVKIWDARYWKQPIASIAADMAGVRKLKFSPLGSGRPVLVAAEPADYVNIINAETFDSKQTLSFFGEIGGFDFTNDGQELIVANCDSSRGGIFEFERCDFATEGLCGKDEQIRCMLTGKKRDNGLSTMAEDLMDESPELRGTTKRRERRTALLTDLGVF
ncbi:hypothetical protein DSL72_004612 [Monilinia vaccinii-corymbosi]|uniref:Anaphase-promoting complex subunit 4 WD40 domain-containing protein n=1 Tax=Monilinia vaccinii-corymbosi TaxID=61207 RepID=A0A8A3NZP1_9HELO|nr:hypothetical protein DSL72_004612 [Monilinia vaccinii-corymbosi]